MQYKSFITKPKFGVNYFRHLNGLREDSQIDFSMPNVNLTYGEREFQPMTFGKIKNSIKIG